MFVQSYSCISCTHFEARQFCGMKVSKFKDGCCSARLLQSKLYIYPFSISSDVGFSHVTSVLHYLLFESHNPLSRIFKIFPPYK